MPLKKDGSGRRWVEMEVLLPGTPEQVWQAMATGDGNAAWFTRGIIEEKVGGKLTFHFGAAGESKGEVTGWEPPHRFAYVETEWSPGAPPVATEITITARSGGECLVRMVHSLFTSSEEWDGQMEGFENGWPGFFEILRLYLRHFAGMPASSAIAMTRCRGDAGEFWRRMVDALGLAGCSVDDSAVLPEPLGGSPGTVELIRQDHSQRMIVLRISGPVPGIVSIGTYVAGEMVSVGATIYLYGDGAAARLGGMEREWQGWLEGICGSGTG